MKSFVKRRYLTKVRKRDLKILFFMKGKKEKLINNNK